MSKVVKKAKKLFQKVIPKEIKPFVAPLAAYYLGPAALKATKLGGLTGVKGFLARAAASGATSAATQKLVEDDVSKSSTLLSALTGGLGAGYGGQGAQTADGIRAAKVAGVTPAGETIRAGQLAGMDLEAANALNLTSPGITGQAQNIALEAAAKASGALTPTTGKGIATLVGTAGTASGIEKEMELLDQYNQSLTEQGIEDKSERISLIRKYMANAGFDESQVTDALGRYGYLANGGRVGYEEGGDVSFEEFMRKKREEEFKSLVDKLMTEQGIQDKGYAFRLADDLMNMKRKGIDTDKLKFLNEQSVLFALPKDMRPEPEYYDALKTLKERVG